MIARLSVGRMIRPATDTDLDAVVSLAYDEETAWYGEPESSREEIAHYVAFNGGLGLSVQAANEKAIGLYRSVGKEVTKEWRVYSRPAVLETAVPPRGLGNQSQFGAALNIDRGSPVPEAELRRRALPTG